VCDVGGQGGQAVGGCAALPRVAPRLVVGGIRECRPRGVGRRRRRRRRQGGRRGGRRGGGRRGRGRGRGRQRRALDVVRPVAVGQRVVEEEAGGAGAVVVSVGPYAPAGQSTGEAEGETRQGDGGLEGSFRQRDRRHQQSPLTGTRSRLLGPPPGRRFFVQP
jgi:hypothetical protein